MCCFILKLHICLDLPTFIQKHALAVSAIEYDLYLATALGVDIVLDRACVNWSILIASHEL